MSSLSQRRRLRYRVEVRHILLYLFCILVFAFLLAPILVIIPMSFSSADFLQFPPPSFSLRWYQNFFSRQDWLSATMLSLRVAIATSLLSTVLGIMAALALARTNFLGKDLIYAFIVSPMIIPAIIIAVAVLFAYARLRLVGSFLGLVLAHTTLALPYVVINVTASLRTFDIDLEKAAMSLGANRLQAFTKITLPLIRPGVFAGALFAFVISWDELVVALFVSGTKAITLPRQMWISLRQDIDPTIASIATLLVIFASVVLLVVELLRRRTST